MQCNPHVSICVDTNPKSHNLQDEFILLVAFSLGKDWMHAAALVSLIWAISLKTTREELLLVRKGNITVEKHLVGILEGCSPKWLQHGTADYN